MTDKMNTQAKMIHRFLRYEIPYQQLQIDPAQADVHISFEDVMAAFERIVQDNIGMLKVLDEWMDPLYMMGDDVYLPEALGFDGVPTSEILLDDINGRSPLNRENTLYHVLGYLWHAPQMFDDEISFHREVGEWLDMMHNTLWNEERPMYEWKLTITQKMHYVMDLFYNERIDLTDSAHQDLFRRCLDELCDEGLYDALKIKAFCSMDGNTVYKKDVELAREYFEICAEEDEDPMAVNALGELYLSGEVNNGVPQYDLAYQYYSVAAFAGVYESICKCADLLSEGNGVIRNAQAAYNQVLHVYTHTKQFFTEGNYSIAFADAAVRMGDCFRQGIGADIDLKLAYSYYLDAENAICKRMRYDKCRGDDELFDRIQQNMARMADLMSNRYMENNCVLTEPLLIDRMLSGGYPLRMQCMPMDNNALKLVFSRTEDTPEYRILLTAENISSSVLSKTIEITAEDVKNIQGSTDIIFNAVGYDFRERKTIFYAGNEAVLSFTAERFIYTEEGRPDNWLEQSYQTYVRVLLKDGSSGEYRCDLPGLKRGDPVVVPSVIGEQEGVVETVFKEKPYRMKEISEAMHVLRKVSLHLMA